MIQLNQVGICLVKVNIKNTRTMCEICSKLIIKIPEFWYFDILREASIHICKVEKTWKGGKIAILLLPIYFCVLC